MTDSPIRISVELEGIEPDGRFQAALDELANASAQLLVGSEEVAGFTGGTMGDEPAMLRAELRDVRPAVKGWSFGARPGPGSFCESLPADLR